LGKAARDKKEEALAVPGEELRDDGLPLLAGSGAQPDLSIGIGLPKVSQNSLVDPVPDQKGSEPFGRIRIRTKCF